MADAYNNRPAHLSASYAERMSATLSLTSKAPSWMYARMAREDVRYK